MFAYGNSFDELVMPPLVDIMEGLDTFGKKN
jgi:hypothetical protein